MLDCFQNLIANCAVEWRPIPGYEGRYEASSSGLIRSCERVTRKTGSRKDPGVIWESKTAQRILRMYERKSANRYRSVGLSKDGKVRTVLVHDAVYCAFNGVPENRRMMVIDHRDGNEHNNSIANLQLIPSARNISKRKAWSTTYGIWKKGDRWVAEIIKDKKKVRIGTFSNEQDALSARISKEKEIFWEFAPIREHVK